MKTKEVKDLDLLDYAYFSSDSYLNECKTTEIPKGWTLVAIAPPSDSGYQAAAFRNEKGEIIISHRGTNFEFSKEGLKDVKSDLTLGLGSFPEQATDAANFTKLIQKQYTPTKIVHTGHSLGGWLADVQARITGSQAIVFDSPGITFTQDKAINFINWVNKNIKGKNLGEPNTIYVLSSINVVNIWGKHGGQVIRLGDYIDGFKPISSHYLEDSIIPALAKYYKEKGLKDLELQKVLNEAFSKYKTQQENTALDFAQGKRQKLNILNSAILIDKPNRIVPATMSVPK